MGRGWRSALLSLLVTASPLTFLLWRGSFASQASPAALGNTALLLKCHKRHKAGKTLHIPEENKELFSLLVASCAALPFAHHGPVAWIVSADWSSIPVPAERFLLSRPSTLFWVTPKCGQGYFGLSLNLLVPQLRNQFT